MNDYGLNPGTALLGRAVGHAAFLYGDQVNDYDSILSVALHTCRAHPDYDPGGTGRHTAPAAPRTARAEYAAGRARQLIAEADSPQFSHDVMDRARWIGAATEIMRELTRDA